MPKRTGISEARRRLFDLVDWVLDHPDEAVYIEHRDRPERVALVREDRLAYLERRESELGPVPPLAGSVEIIGGSSVEEVVADVRASAGRDAERRTSRIADDLGRADG